MSEYRSKTVYWVATTSSQKVSADGRVAHVDVQLLGPYESWKEANVHMFKARSEGLVADVVCKLETIK